MRALSNTHWIACGFALVMSASSLAASRNVSADEPTMYLRVSEEKGRFIALDIATRDYVRADGSGPRVALVGVAHIGDQAFYDAIAALLSEYEIVLFESVKPEGTGGAGGETDEQRIASTKAAMRFVGSIIETHRAKVGHYPSDIAALTDFAGTRDPRLSQFLESALVDAWGRSLVYTFIAPNQDAIDEPGSYLLLSLGADGDLGGEGIDADLSLADLPQPKAMAESEDDGLQGQLASALGLKFQLDALPYDSPNWRCSDMAMDELNRRFQEKGLDFGMIGGTLAGSSLPAMAIKFLLGLLKMADSFTDGAITDTFKVVMIEMLGNPMILDQGLAQFGRGFSEIIVEDRNQVVIDDLKKLLQREPEVKSVALLYGAAHMPDMAARLAEQLDFHPVPEEQTRWLTAMKVDLTQSKIPPGQLQQIRTMMKQTLQRQMRGR